MRVRVLGAALERPGRRERDLVCALADDLQALSVADQLEFARSPAGIRRVPAVAERLHAAGDRGAARDEFERIAGLLQAPAPVRLPDEADRLLRGRIRAPAVAELPGRRPGFRGGSPRVSPRAIMPVMMAMMLPTTGKSVKPRMPATRLKMAMVLVGRAAPG